MKTAIAFEVFYFLKVYIFEELLILNVLYQKDIANITFKQFTKYCFTLCFIILFKKWAKKEEDDDTFLRKKSRRKTKQCYHIELLD